MNDRLKGNNMQELTPLEALRVAAFGFDRPEGVGAASFAANDAVSGGEGTTRPTGDADASTGRTAETERGDRDAEFFQLGWVAALREVRVRAGQPFGEFRIDGFLWEQLGADDAAS